MADMQHSWDMRGPHCVSCKHQLGGCACVLWEGHICSGYAWV
jgi:hypothetical protein